MSDAGFMLVAAQTQIYLLDLDTGAIVQTYDHPDVPGWFDLDGAPGRVS